MPTHVDTEAVKRAAKALLDNRVELVVQIAEAQQTMLDKQEEAAAAEREHAALWAAGVREGWTEAQLKGMNLVPPGRKAPGRPARARRAGRAASANGAATAPAPVGGGGGE
jgi:hypothetical protein